MRGGAKRGRGSKRKGEAAIPAGGSDEAAGISSMRAVSCGRSETDIPAPGGSDEAADISSMRAVSCGRSETDIRSSSSSLRKSLLLLLTLNIIID